MQRRNIFTLICRDCFMMSPLMLATVGGRGSKTRAQRMPADVFGRETGMSIVALDDQGDGPIAEALGTDFTTFRYGPENRNILDANKF